MSAPTGAIVQLVSYRRIQCSSLLQKDWIAVKKADDSQSVWQNRGPDRSRLSSSPWRGALITITLRIQGEHNAGMLTTKCINPEIMVAIALRSHGDRILIADGNYPLHSQCGNAPKVYL